MSLDQLHMSDLLPDEQRLLDALVRYERPASHRVLKAQTGLGPVEYESAKRGLIDKQKVGPYRCQGGGLKLLAPELPEPEIDEKRIEEVKNAEEKAEERIKELKIERDFAPVVKKWLEKEGYEVCKFVGDNTERYAWENPDLIALAKRSLEWFVGPCVEVTAVEMKLNFTPQAIWQAAHYRSFSHYVYLACVESPMDIRQKADGRLLETAVGLGIGIVAITKAGAGGKGYTCQEINCASRQSPTVAELDRLLSDYQNEFPDLVKPGAHVITQMNAVVSKNGTS